jgi:nicotinamide mononucleotide (NMN) deamidase PncC
LVASNTLYSTTAKQEFLNSNIGEDWKALSEDLASKSKLKYNSNISLAILGEAGPIPSSNYKIGQIFISITTESKSETYEHNLRGSRQDIINRSVNNAIWDLINFIKKL